MERIIAAAIIVNDEKFSLPQPARHADIYELIASKKVRTYDASIHECFLTDTNRFVSRYEAAQIARKANQIISHDFNQNCLYSEDVW